MYFVSAPAAACDDFRAITPDNASNQNNRTDLKLVASEPTASLPPAEGPASEPDLDTDPGALAARILQMHAASDAPEQPGCPAPKLIGTTEDPALDLPGILQRRTGPAAALRLDPDVVPQLAPAAIPEASRSGPGFVPLLASTAVLAVLLGGGFYVFSSSLPGQSQETRLVQTQEITPAPTIESLIAEDTAAQEDNAPNAQQVANAKDRIRRAFHASGTAAHVPGASSEASLDAGAASMMEDGKIQARLAPNSPQSIATRSPHSDGSTLRLATAATDLQLPASGLSGPQSAAGPTPTGTPSALPGAPAPQAAADDTTVVTASLEETAVVDGSYPHQGVISAAVNMRQSDDKDAPVLEVIPAGTEVRYDACGPWWCGVTHQGKTGFVGQKFLTRTQ